MTEKSNLELAQAAGFNPTWSGVKELNVFAALVRADEREKCAALCEDIHMEYKRWTVAIRCAEAIRSRK